MGVLSTTPLAQARHGAEHGDSAKGPSVCQEQCFSPQRSSIVPTSQRAGAADP